MRGLLLKNLDNKNVKLSNWLHCHVYAWFCLIKNLKKIQTKQWASFYAWFCLLKISQQCQKEKQLASLSCLCVVCFKRPADNRSVTLPSPSIPTQFEHYHDHDYIHDHSDHDNWHPFLPSLTINMIMIMMTRSYSRHISAREKSNMGNKIGEIYLHKRKKARKKRSNLRNPIDRRDIS